MNKAESKYFNTAVRMDQAFLEILETKDIEYISVKEICERAEVNRSTFYLHYETIDDLLNECIRYMAEQFITYFDGKSISDKIQTGEKQDLFLVTSVYLIPYLTYIKEHRRLFQVALNRTNVLGADRSMEVLFKNTFNPIMIRYGIPEKERRYIVAYYIEGMIAMVKIWLQDGCSDSIDFLVSLMQKMIPNPNEQ